MRAASNEWQEKDSWYPQGKIYIPPMNGQLRLDIVEIPP